MRTLPLLMLAFSTCASAQLSNGLKGHWSFGGDYTDGSGNGHNATTSGTVSFTTDRFGSPNCAVLFNGDHLSTPDGPDFDIPDSGAFSISLWYQGGSASVGDLEIMFERWSPSVAPVPTDYHLGIYDVNKPSFGSLYSPVIMPAPGVTPNDQNWHHMVGIYENYDWYLYYDDQLVASATPSQYGIFQGAGEIRMGRDFFGALDDVRFYDRVLGIAEIDSLFYEQNTCTTNSLAENSANHVTIGPNPTTGPVQVQLPSTPEQGTILTVTDAGGRVVYRERMINRSISIDLSGSPAGLYHLRLTSPSAEQIVKFVRE
ncbi:MAG: T9SS type A sorting domain-containing protein [Flavobacteriales bacterium]|nr:T9SS type A sorting domain-containing protein [Flavobacteriales bacterium]